MNIEFLNKEIKKCKKCRLYETRENAICGEGDLDSNIIMIAQAPGEKEDKEGKMFIGPSGEILNDLFKSANIDRKTIYMTNLIKCMLPKCRRPKSDEIYTCSEYLDREIKLINPQIIVPLGYFATRYIFNKYDLKLPQKSEFYKLYGKVFLVDGKKIFPLRHPAAVLHNNEIKGEMRKEYNKLKIIQKDCKWYPVCPMKWFYEKGVLDKEWIENYCMGDWESCVRYYMEERGESHPDWMLPDGKIDYKLHMICYEN